VSGAAGAWDVRQCRGQGRRQHSALVAPLSNGPSSRSTNRLTTSGSAGWDRMTTSGRPSVEAGASMLFWVPRAGVSTVAGCGCGDGGWIWEGAMYEPATTIARRDRLSLATDVRASGLARADPLAPRALAAHSGGPRVQRGTRSRITSSGRPARSVALGTARALPLIAMWKITPEPLRFRTKSELAGCRCASGLAGRCACPR
jgi:hypothetical protein